jgi:hypothetical protein
LEWATAQERSASLDLWQTLADRLDVTQKKPRRVAGFEVACQPSTHGDPIYVLKSPSANHYLKLDARDYVLWEQMDGEHTVRDLAVAYFMRYSAFPFERLVQLLAQLKANGLLDERPMNVFGGATTHVAARRLAYRLQHFAETATQKELALNNADGFFDALYRRAGWLWFTRTARLLYLALTPLGVAVFGWLLLTGAYPLLSSGGSYGLGLIVLMSANYAMILVHEGGHAMALKFYGRSVPKGGVLFHFGAPAFFVDATDAWMVPTRARMVISFAGPFATIVLGSLLAIAIVIFPSFPLNPLLFQAAFMSFFSAIKNLAPLLECDGYFILMDRLEIPMLRKKSFAFLREQVVGKVAARAAFSREELILTYFGLFTAVITAFIVVVAVYLWQSRVTAMLDALLSGSDPVSTILAAPMVIMVGAPLVFGLAIQATLIAGTMIERVQRLKPIGF